MMEAVEGFERIEAGSCDADEAGSITWTEWALRASPESARVRCVGWLSPFGRRHC